MVWMTDLSLVNETALLCVTCVCECLCYDDVMYDQCRLPGVVLWKALSHNHLYPQYQHHGAVVQQPMQLLLLLRLLQ